MSIDIFETERFLNWFDGLKDSVTRGRIQSRIDRLRFGNLGDFDTVGDSVLELRFHFGSDYRIYCMKDGHELVILLCGGDKSTQDKDILEAKRLAKEYMEEKL